ncbi:LppU/SCO3897 family protein [Yinghuangia sp. YIM S10712]|uniref:LppU/SCO3897 family protein n=1 Tax=Yinghuangia sp. YIM S10712 TaxID=3436930 RepID=UPI003F52F41E
MSNPFAGGPQGPGQQPQQPYGQVPPQQPYGGQPQQPNFYAGPPVQPPQQQRRPWLKWLRIGVPVVVIAIAAIAYFVGNKDDATKAEVGDCLTSSADADDIKTVSCDKPSAAFRVIEKFTDTSSTSKCETEELLAKGSVGAFYWSGAGKGVLCFTFTKNTTVEQASKIGITSQEELDEYRQQLAAAGVPGLQ